MFDYFKKIAIANRADDELLYEYVLNEMENDIIVKGLWAKALANSNGDESNAKSIYMKYRVQSIKDIFTAEEISYNELTKPKLFQYIQDKILPISHDYTDLYTSQSKPEIVEDYKVNEYEESIYDEVAKELSNNIRKEGLWLKAIQNTDGDENKTLSLYIKYRSESIKVEKEKLAAEKQRIKEIEKEKAENASLEVFLKKHNLIKIKNISDTKIIANYNNSPIDANLEFIDGAWHIIDS